jgi:hypothetical protein
VSTLKPGNAHWKNCEAIDGVEDIFWTSKGGKSIGQITEWQQWIARGSVTLRTALEQQQG